MVTNDCGPCLFAGISEFLTHSFLGVPHPNSTRCPQIYHRPLFVRQRIAKSSKELERKGELFTAVVGELD